MNDMSTAYNVEFELIEGADELSRSIGEASQALEIANSDVASLSREQRREFANLLHREVVETSHLMAKAWYKLASLVEPIDRYNLWRDIRHDIDGVQVSFDSFKDYVDVVLLQPITSVRNTIYAYRALVDAGRDPEELADVRLTRVQDLTKVLKAYDGAPPEEVWEPLVDAARTATTREESKAFKAAVTEVCQSRGVEVDDFLRIRCQSSQLEMIRHTIELQKAQKKSVSSSMTDASALEFICAEWFINVYQASEGNN